jgi:putative lipoprotein
MRCGGAAMTRIPRWTVVAGMPLALVALATLVAAEQPTPPAAITGQVVYRERIALPPDAVVRVWLEVAAEPERPARRVAEITVPTEGKQVPIPFTLPYDAARISPGKSYLVRATIRSGDQVLFASRSRYPVITKGAPSKVEIVVEPAGTGARRPPRTPSPDAAVLSATPWKLTALGDTPAPAGGAASIAFDSEKGRISGSTGCNQFFGTYETGDGSALKLTPVGQTLMACIGEGDAQEKAFLDALRATASYRVSGKSLELLDAEARVLARFTAAGEVTAPAH